MQLSELIQPLPWDGKSDKPRDPEGKVIIPPGLYSLPNRDAFRHTAGVSKSRIGNYHRSAAYDQAKRDHPEWFPSTGAQVLGNMLDTLLFEPEAFSRYFVTPEGFQNKGKENQAKMKAWKEKYGEAYVIHDSKAKAAYRRVETLVKKARAREFLAMAASNGHPHVAVYWQDWSTGLSCKAELDYIREIAGENGDTGLLITDLKTTDNASYDAFARTYANFMYDVQAAFFSDGVAAATGIQPDFLFAVVESSPPYEPAEYLADPNDIEAAREHYQVLLRYIQWCRKHRTYPGYPTMQEVRRPRYAARLTLEGAKSIFAQRGIDL